MAERKKLPALRRLAEVQRAQRAGAEAALSEARRAEERSRAEEEAARRGTESARGDWLRFVGEPGFSPEYARALGGEVLKREATEADCTAETRRAAAAAGERDTEWRLRSAQLKGSERSLRRLVRKDARDREERRLAAAADLVTFRWSRP